MIILYSGIHHRKNRTHKDINMDIKHYLNLRFCESLRVYSWRNPAENCISQIFSIRRYLLFFDCIYGHINFFYFSALLSWEEKTKDRLESTVVLPTCERIKFIETSWWDEDHDLKHLWIQALRNLHFDKAKLHFLCITYFLKFAYHIRSPLQH